jgi:ankyrin repeat protein
VCSGNLKCIKILLELSVSLNVTDDADANPLLVALESKHFEIADYILNYAQKEKKVNFLLFVFNGAQAKSRFFCTPLFTVRDEMKKKKRESFLVKNRENQKIHKVI